MVRVVASKGVRSGLAISVATMAPIITVELSSAE